VVHGEALVPELGMHALVAAARFPLADLLDALNDVQGLTASIESVVASASSFEGRDVQSLHLRVGPPDSYALDGGLRDMSGTRKADY